MTIREIKQEELPVYLQLLEELDKEQVLPLPEAKKLWEKIQAYPFYKIYMAIVDETIVGTFTLIICDNFGHGSLKFAIVENVVVLPEWSGKGIGKKMMNEAVNIAGGHHCYKLMLSSNNQRTSAHAFYDSLGFERHGVSFKTELIR